MASKPHQMMEERKAYMRRWYLKHRERLLKEAKDRYAGVKVPKRVKTYQTAEERKASRRRWHEANPDTFVRLKAGVRLSGMAYNALLAQQGGRCAICGKPPRRKRLAIDHDHAQATVRGLLCGKCNLALGAFQDNPALLRAAAIYLEAHQARLLKGA